MKRKLVGLLLVLSLLTLVVPASICAQSRKNEYAGFIRRDGNSVRVGDTRISLFDGPGIVNYDYKHRWMPGAGGAATVIGIGAGAGAGTGALVKGKKGAAMGALIGGGTATGIWLYKNRTERRKIF